MPRGTQNGEIGPTPFLLRPRGRAGANLFRDNDFARQRRFFAERPALTPTPLHRLPALAASLGIRELLVKDETARFGLNAFKAAGAMFAVTTLIERGAIREGDTLVCASEGNHGRAVARAARDAGCAARVYLAESVAPARIQAIQSEGAIAVSVAGTYDDAVRVMARDAAANGWTVISDTSWEGYDEIPRLIMLGYTRLMDEAEQAWSPDPAPDIVLVQAGVGGLLAAVACWADHRFGHSRPAIIGVEPSSATCVQTSIRNGRPTTLPGPFDTVMGGLRCGEMSPVAFDSLNTLVDGFVGIDDDWAFDAMRRLARPADGDPRIAAGASGAAACGGLLAILRDPSLEPFRVGLGLGPASRAVVLVTEGVTDPAGFEAVLSRA
jgi:diaminopropionate ammonia-lyase